MSDETDAATVLELATELTIAWLSNPGTRITADELPAVIEKIHGALAGLASGGGAEIEAAPEYVPAVSVRKSLASRDHLISLVDGKPYKMLKRHLSLNGLTPAEYRQRYGLRPDYPMVAEAYSEKRRNLARSIGLGRKPGEKPAAKAAAGTRASAATKPAPAGKASPAAKVTAKPARAAARKPAKAKATAAAPADLQG